MNYTHDQARQLADLEAAFVSEMLGLESLRLVAAKAEHIEDLQPHVEGWLSDWRDYHARNGHTPLIKAALTVALQRVEPYRVTAAIWTFHRTNSPANSANLANPAPQTAPAGARVVLAPAGSRFGTCEAMIDGQLASLPGTVAQALRDIASGQSQIRLRLETWRKLAALMPWLADHLRRNDDLKAKDRKSAYEVNPLARSLISTSRV